MFVATKSFKIMLSEKIRCCFFPKRMRLVHPYADREPNMVLIEGLKGGKSRITIEKPLVVYKEPNVYTDEIYEIYGDKPRNNGK